MISTIDAGAVPSTIVGTAETEVTVRSSVAHDELLEPPLSNAMRY
jgi:hypothetical protein